MSSINAIPEGPRPSASMVVLQGMSNLMATEPDPGSRGLQALRLLRHAGMTWSDLFQPVSDVEPEFRETLEPFAAWAISAADTARCALLFLHLATPSELAEIAVAICMGYRLPSETDNVTVILRRLSLAESLPPKRASLTRYF